MPAAAAAPPCHLEAHRRRRLARRRPTVVHDRHVARVQRDDVTVRGDGDRLLRKAHGPDEARRRDPAVEVVRWRARTGLEQLYSDEGERPPPLHPVRGHVVPLEEPDVVRHTHRWPVASRTLPRRYASATRPWKFPIVLGS